MSWVDQTLADFGRGIGIDNLTLNAQGVAQLQLQSGTLLAVELVDEQVLVYIAQMLAFEDEALKLRALRAADFRNGGAFPVQIGLSGTGMDAMLIVLTRVPERKFTLPLLGQAFDSLCGWYEAVQKK